MSDQEQDCPRCRRFLHTLRELSERLTNAEQEGHALREELLAAGEMIEDLASEIERLSG